MTEWERLAEQHYILKPWVNIGLRWATKYYVRMDDTEAYVVTMCKVSNLTGHHLLLTLILVLNPAIRMSWIQNQWEAKYIRSSRDIILKLVSTTSLYLYYIPELVSLVQMNRYRSLNSTSTAPTATPNSPDEPAPAPGARVKPLPTRFKVERSVYEKRTPDSFTVDAEYRKYTSGENSSEGTDILWFWEVRLFYFQ